MKVWPNKIERENYEIKEFIRAYSKLKHGRSFEVVCKTEQPDYLVKDLQTGEEFGVELTSVYVNNRSVPDNHKNHHDQPVDIPFNEDEIRNYKERILNAIKAKNEKARNYSDVPLILSIYLNEYCAIYMNRKDEWTKFIKDNEGVLDSVSSFSEIVFWSLPNDMVISIRPER